MRDRSVGGGLGFGRELRCEIGEDQQPDQLVAVEHGRLVDLPLVQGAGEIGGVVVRAAGEQLGGHDVLDARAVGGLRIRHGRCYHGVALNAAMDLTPFAAIDPCGFPQLEVTSLQALGVSAALDALGDGLIESLQRNLAQAASLGSDRSEGRLLIGTERSEGAT